MELQSYCLYVRKFLGNCIFLNEQHFVLSKRPTAIVPRKITVSPLKPLTVVHDHWKYFIVLLERKNEDNHRYKKLQPVFWFWNPINIKKLYKLNVPSMLLMILFKNIVSHVCYATCWWLRDVTVGYMGKSFFFNKIEGWLSYS